LITPDYPGVVREVVERATGALCLYLQGAAGNTHAVVDYVGDPAVYRRLGAILGHEAAKVALRLQTVPRRERLVQVLESGGPLRASMRPSRRAGGRGRSASPPDPCPSGSGPTRRPPRRPPKRDARPSACTPCAATPATTSSRRPSAWRDGRACSPTRPGSTPGTARSWPTSTGSASGRSPSSGSPASPSARSGSA